MLFFAETVVQQLCSNTTSRVGHWHDVELGNTNRRVSPQGIRDLGHVFAFRAAAETGADAYESERWLGHRSQHCIRCHTNPPEGVALDYVEEL